MNERIPKIKKKEIKNNLQTVDVNNRDVQNLLREINKTCLDTEFKNEWEVLEFSMVHNSELEGNYIKKRAELKDEGRTVASLQDQLGFLVTSLSCKTPIITNGLKATTKQMSNRLGQGECGVYINRYFDIELRCSWKAGDISKEIFVFKFFYGKRKGIALNNLVVTETSLEPTPNYDCHTSSVHPKKEDTPYRQHALSSVYLYEYTDACEPSKYPRQCLPYAIIKCRKRLVMPKHVISNHQILSKKENQPSSLKNAQTKTLLPTPTRNAIEDKCSNSLQTTQQSSSSVSTKSSPLPTSCQKPSSSSSDINQNTTFEQSKSVSSVVTQSSTSSAHSSKSAVSKGSTEKKIVKKIEKRANSMEGFLHQTPQYIDRLNEACAKLQNEQNSRMMNMMSSILPSVLGNQTAQVDNFPQPPVILNSKCIQSSSTEVRDPRLNRSTNTKVLTEKKTGSADDKAPPPTSTHLKPKKLNSETKKMSYSEYVKLKAIEKEKRGGDVEKPSAQSTNQTKPSQSSLHNEKNQINAAGNSTQSLPKSICSDYLSKFQSPHARPESKLDFYSQFQSPIHSQQSSSQNLFHSLLAANSIAPESSITNNECTSSKPLSSSPSKPRPRVEKKAFLPFPVLCEDGSVKNVFRGTIDGSLKEMPSSSAKSKAKDQIETNNDAEESESPTPNVQEGASKLFKAFQNVFADDKKKKLIERQLSNGRKEDSMNTTSKDSSPQEAKSDAPSKKEDESLDRTKVAVSSTKSKRDHEHGKENLIGDEGKNYCSVKNIDTPPCKDNEKAVKNQTLKHTSEYGDKTCLKSKETENGKSSKYFDSKKVGKDKNREDIKGDVKSKNGSDKKHSKTSGHDKIDQVNKDGKSKDGSIREVNPKTSRSGKISIMSNRKPDVNKNAGNTKSLEESKDVAPICAEKTKEKRKHESDKGSSKSETNTNYGHKIAMKKDVPSLNKPDDLELVSREGVQDSSMSLGAAVNVSTDNHVKICAAEECVDRDGKVLANDKVEPECNLLFEDSRLSPLLPSNPDTYPRFVCRSPNADIPGINFSLDLAAQTASTKSYCSPLRLIPSLCDDESDLVDDSKDQKTKEICSESHVEESVLSPIDKQSCRDNPENIFQQINVQKPSLVLYESADQEQSRCTKEEKSHFVRNPNDEPQSLCLTPDEYKSAFTPVDKSSTGMPIDLSQFVSTLAKKLASLPGSCQLSGQVRVVEKERKAIGNSGSQSTDSGDFDRTSVSSLQKADPNMSISSTSMPLKNAESVTSNESSNNVFQTKDAHVSPTLNTQHEIREENSLKRDENVLKQSSSSSREGIADMRKSPLSSSSSLCLLIDESCESSTSINEPSVRAEEKFESNTKKTLLTSSDGCSLSSSREGIADMRKSPFSSSSSLCMLIDESYESSTSINEHTVKAAEKFESNTKKTLLTSSDVCSSSSSREGIADMRKSPLSSSSSLCMLIDESCESSTSINEQTMRAAEKSNTKKTLLTSSDGSSDNNSDDSESEEEGIARPFPKSLSLQELGFGFYLQVLSARNYQPSVMVLDFKEAIDKGYHDSECNTCKKELRSDIITKYINGLSEEDSSTSDQEDVVPEPEIVFKDSENSIDIVSHKEGCYPEEMPVSGKSLASTTVADTEHRPTDICTMDIVRSENYEEKKEYFPQTKCDATNNSSLISSSGSHEMHFSSANKSESQCREFVKQKNDSSLTSVKSISSPQKDILERYKSYKASLIKRQRERNQLMKIKEKLKNKGVVGPMRRKQSDDERKADSTNIKDDDELRDTLLDDLLTCSADKTKTLESKSESVHRDSDPEQWKTNAHPLDLYDMLEKDQYKLEKFKVVQKSEVKTFPLGMVPRSAQKFFKMKEMKCSKKEDNQMEGKNSKPSDTISSECNTDTENVSDNGHNKTMMEKDHVDKDKMSSDKSLSHTQATKWKPFSELGNVSERDNDTNSSSEIHIKSINLSSAPKCKHGIKVSPKSESKICLNKAKLTTQTVDSNDSLGKSHGGLASKSGSREMKDSDQPSFNKECTGDAAVGSTSKDEMNLKCFIETEKSEEKAVCDMAATDNSKEAKWKSMTEVFQESNEKNAILVMNENQSKCETIHDTSLGKKDNVSESSSNDEKLKCALNDLVKPVSENQSQVAPGLAPPDLSLYLNQPLGDVDYRVGFNFGQQGSTGLSIPFLNSDDGEVEDFGDVDYRTRLTPAIFSKDVSSSHNCIQTNNYMYKPLNSHSHPPENNYHNSSASSEVTPQGNMNHRDNGIENVEYHEPQNEPSGNKNNQDEIGCERKLLIWPSIEPSAASGMVHRHLDVGNDSNLQTKDKADEKYDVPINAESKTSETDVCSRYSIASSVATSLSSDHITEPRNAVLNCTAVSDEKKETREESFPAQKEKNPQHTQISCNSALSNPPLESKDDSHIHKEQVETPNLVSGKHNESDLFSNQGNSVSNCQSHYWMKPKTDNCMNADNSDNAVINKCPHQTVPQASVLGKSNIVMENENLQEYACKNFGNSQECKEEESNNVVENIKKCLPELLGTHKISLTEIENPYSDDDESDEESNSANYKKRKLEQSPEIFTSSDELTEGFGTKKIDLSQDHVSMLKRAIETVTQYKPSANSAIDMPEPEESNSESLGSGNINLTQDHMLMLKKAINTVTQIVPTHDRVKSDEFNTEVFEPGKDDLTKDLLSVLKRADKTFQKSELHNNDPSVSPSPQSSSEYLLQKEAAIEQSAKIPNMKDVENYGTSSSTSPSFNDCPSELLSTLVTHISKTLGVNIRMCGKIPSSSHEEKNINVAKSSHGSKECLSTEKISSDNLVGSSDCLPVPGKLEAKFENYETPKTSASTMDIESEQKKVLLSDVPLEALTRAKLHVLEQLKSLNEDDVLEDTDFVDDDNDNDNTIIDEKDDSLLSESDDGTSLEMEDCVSRRKKKKHEGNYERGEVLWSPKDKVTDRNLSSGKMHNELHSVSQLHNEPNKKLNSKFVTTNVEVVDISSDSDHKNRTARRKRKRKSYKEDKRIVILDTSSHVFNNSRHSQSPLARKENYDSDSIVEISSPSDLSRTSTPRNDSPPTGDSFISCSNARYASSDSDCLIVSSLKQRAITITNTNTNDIIGSSCKGKIVDVESTKMKYQDLKICLDNTSSNREVKPSDKRRVVVRSSSKDDNHKSESKNDEDSDVITDTLTDFLKAARNSSYNSKLPSKDKGKHFVRGVSKDKSDNETKSTSKQADCFDGEKDCDSVKQDTSGKWKEISKRAREELQFHGAYDRTEKCSKRVCPSDEHRNRSPVLNICRDRIEKCWLKDKPIDQNCNISPEMPLDEELPGRSLSRSRDRHRNMSPDAWNRDRKEERHRHSYETSPVSSSAWDSNRKEKHSEYINGMSPISSCDSEISEEPLLSPNKRRRVVSSEDLDDECRKVINSRLDFPTKERKTPDIQEHVKRGYNKFDGRERMQEDSESDRRSDSDSFRSCRERSYSPKTKYSRRLGSSSKNSSSSSCSPLERSVHKRGVSKSFQGSDLVDYFAPSQNFHVPRKISHRNENTSKFPRASFKERPHPLDELMPLQKKRVHDGEEELDYYLNRKKSHYYGHSHRGPYNSRRY